MNKKNLLLLALYVAVYAGLYFWLKHSGLWARYRWAGLMFGAAWAVTYVLIRKNDRTNNLGLRYAIFCCLVGVILLFDFLIRHGDSTGGFLASMFLGYAADGVHTHYKARQLATKNKADTP